MEKDITLKEIKTYIELKTSLMNFKGKEYIINRRTVEDIRKKVISYFGFDLNKRKEKYNL